MRTSKKTTCYCCGYITSEGSWEICERCFWQADPVQEEYVNVDIGANHMTLIDAQHNYQQIGCCKPRLLEHVRPSDDDVLDPEWRPVDPDIDLQDEQILDPMKYFEVTCEVGCGDGTPYWKRNNKNAY